MTAALRYEWARITTLRSTWWILGLSVLVPTGLAGLLAATLNLDDFSGYEDVVTAVVLTQGAVVGFPLLLAYLTGLIGVFAFGHEYRHGMIRATLTAVPRRGAVLAAKVFVTAVAVALGSLVSALTALLIGSVLSGGLVDVDAGGTWRVIGGMVAYCTLFALTGLALAAIFRNQVAALVTVLLAPSVLEQVVGAVLTIPEALNSVEFLTRYLPFDAGSQLYKPANVFNVGDFFGPKPLEPLTGGLVMLIFTTVLLAVAFVLFAERDA
jgi:ABC-type transport system involved in multi-copper enzyme maturation permease subunit